MNNDQLQQLARETWGKLSHTAEPDDPDVAIILSALEQACKMQADETRRCIEMVGGLREQSRSRSRSTQLRNSPNAYMTPVR
jgi:hypothetical protein